MRQPLNTEDEVYIQPSRDKQGRMVFNPTLTPRADQRSKVLLAELPAVIPVIFLPGIMGSNLRNKATKEPVWMPPNIGFNVADILGAIKAVWTWGRRDAKKRQKALKAEDLEVHDGGTIDVGNSGLSRDTARERGWGSVHRMYYHPIMALMEKQLNAELNGLEGRGWWDNEGAREPADYGEERGGLSALTDGELNQAAGYTFDVWCCGYNWLASNRDSGKDLIDYIQNTVLPHYRERDDIGPEQADQMKVVLVSHSMGGFVARAATELHGCDKVLGVSHGVQPATGAPAIYHHMRCGYEGLSRIILGANAGEVTAVVANAPGALELTPTFDHRNGQPWLFVTGPDGRLLKPPLPQNGNPYEEIYKSPEWYGLVPKQNEKYLDMSGKSTGPAGDTRSEFHALIDDVAKFHRDFAGNYHPETYAHYGADDNEKMHSWQNCNWQGHAHLLEETATAPQDNGRGSYRTRSMRTAPELTKVQGSGDATVCSFSGAAPGKAGAKASFRQGSLGKGQYATAGEGYAHPDSYMDPRAEWATLYSVVKIAQQAYWHPEDD